MPKRTIMLGLGAALPAGSAVMWATRVEKSNGLSLRSAPVPGSASPVHAPEDTASCSTLPQGSGRLVVGEGQPDPHRLTIDNIRGRAEAMGFVCDGHEGTPFGYFARFRRR